METTAQNLIMKTTWLKLRWLATNTFVIHLFVDKDFEVLAEASPTVRAVVRVSPGRTLRNEERKTTASSRLLLWSSRRPAPWTITGETCRCWKTR